MNTIFILSCLLTGFISGWSAGFFGIGGGVINVPFLMALFSFFNEPGDPVRKSIVTSLSVVFLCSLSSAITHFRSNRNLFFKVLLILGLSGGTGAFIGAHSALFLRPSSVKKAFGMLEIATALYLISSKEKEVEDAGRAPVFFLSIFAFLAGICSGMFGVGGGIVFIPLMRLCTNYPLHEIIGYSSGIIPFVSLFGLSRYLVAQFSTGEQLISLKSTISMALTSILGAQAGAKAVYKISRERLKMFYAVFLLCVGILLISG